MAAMCLGGHVYIPGARRRNARQNPSTTATVATIITAKAAISPASNVLSPESSPALVN